MNEKDINSILGINNATNGENGGVRPMKAPGTELPDGSALSLKAVGQFHITVGWIVGLIFLGFAIYLVDEDEDVGGIVCLILAIISVVVGYYKGARAKAIGKAALEASKAAERSARIEQMLVNMVNGSGNIPQPQISEQHDHSQVVCQNCGINISASSKFCPECGWPVVKTCAQCGSALEIETKFCPECGAPTK